MKCYLCVGNGITKEHVPAKCFFPIDKRINLMTVPSCELHNTKTSLDDEYIRNVISLTRGTNEIAGKLFEDKGFKSMLNSSGLARVMTKNPQRLNFVKDDETSTNLTFMVDRFRFDNGLRKIAFGLYFYNYKETWMTELFIATEHFITTDYLPDPIAKKIKNLPDLKVSAKYHGYNQDVFKYAFVESESHIQKLLLMNFYNFFEVWAIPFFK